jgi:hypothetical protein
LFGNLAEQQTDTTGSRVHQAGVVRREGVCATGEIVRCHPLQQYSRCLLRGDVVRDAHETRRRSHDFFGIRARDAVESDPVPDFERRNAFSDLHHNAGGLATDGHGQ